MAERDFWLIVWFFLFVVLPVIICQRQCINAKRDPILGILMGLLLSWIGVLVIYMIAPSIYQPYHDGRHDNYRPVNPVLQPRNPRYTRMLRRPSEKPMSSAAIFALVFCVLGAFGVILYAVSAKNAETAKHAAEAESARVAQRRAEKEDERRRLDERERREREQADQQRALDAQLRAQEAARRPVFVDTSKSIDARLADIKARQERDEAANAEIARVAAEAARERENAPKPQADVQAVKINLDGLAVANDAGPRPEMKVARDTERESKRIRDSEREERERKLAQWKKRLTDAKSRRNALAQNQPSAPVVQTSRSSSGVTIVQGVGNEEYERWQSKVKALDTEIATCDRFIESLERQNQAASR